MLFSTSPRAVWKACDMASPEPAVLSVPTPTQRLRLLPRDVKGRELQGLATRPRGAVAAGSSIFIAYWSRIYIYNYIICTI